MEAIFKWLCVITIFFIQSCEKTDHYDQIKIDYQYNGKFSFVIGSTFLNLSVTGINLPPAWETQPDLLNIPDTLQLRDYLPFEPNQWIENDTDKISKINIKIRGENQFPASSKLRLQLTDSKKNPIPGFEQSGMVNIDAATFKDDSTSDVNGKFETYIEINRTEMQKISSAHYLLIDGIIENHTKHPTQYKYYKNFNITTGVGVQVEFDFRWQN